jgi:hypothetical protein
VSDGNGQDRKIARAGEPPKHCDLAVLTFATTVRDLADRDLLYARKGRNSRYTLQEALSFRCSWDVVVAVRWAIAGQVTGHEWHACGRCQSVALLPIEKGQKCHMTPKCEGHMRRLAVRPRKSRDLRNCLLDWPSISGNPLVADHFNFQSETGHIGT